MKQDLHKVKRRYMERRYIQKEIYREKMYIKRRHIWRKDKHEEITYTELRQIKREDI